MLRMLFVEHFNSHCQTWELNYPTKQCFCFKKNTLAYFYQLLQAPFGHKTHLETHF